MPPSKKRSSIPLSKKPGRKTLKTKCARPYEEHKQIESLLAQISSIMSADETYDMKIKVLKEDVEHHIKEEEGEMFPDAKKFLGERLIELGAKLESRKEQLETTPKSKPVSSNQP